MATVKKQTKQATFYACLICKCRANVGEKILHHRGGSYRDGWMIHLRCLKTIVGEEPEFINAETVASKFEQLRSSLIAKYQSPGATASGESIISEAAQT